MLEESEFERNNALLFFYKGENKDPEKMSTSEWCKRVEQINWALKYLGLTEVKK